MVLVAALVAVYFASGPYGGLPGNATKYLLISVSPEEWHRVPIHFGYFFIIWCATALAVDLQSAVVFQVMVAVVFGGVGLFSIYGICREFLPEGWRNHSSHDVAFCTTLLVGISGGYWLSSVSGEIAGPQNSLILLACLSFLRGRHLRGAALFAASCCISPMAALAFPGALYCYSRTLRTESARSILYQTALCSLWLIPLGGLYFQFNLIPGMPLAHAGHGLPPATIPLPDAGFVLAKIYVRTLPGLCPFILIGIVVGIRQFAAWKPWHVMSICWVLSHIWLLPRLGDAYTHTLIWFVAASVYATIGILWVSDRWTSRRWRQRLLVGVVGFQLIAMMELWVIPIHLDSRAFNHAARTMVANTDERTVWMGSYGVGVAYTAHLPEHSESESRFDHPMNDHYLGNIDHEGTWASAIERARTGHTVLAVFDNRKHVGPLLGHLFEWEVAISEGTRKQIPEGYSLEHQQQIGTLGFYRLTSR